MTDVTPSEMPADSPQGPSSPGNPIGRFAWQSAGLAIGRGAALVALLLIARELGQERYGTFVVMLALLELATVPWKPTVQQGAAARLGEGAGHRTWRRTMVIWWAGGLALTTPIVWVFAGPIAALAVGGAATANAVMIEYVPEHILTGNQRRIAIATASNQLTRLGLTIAFVGLGALTPTWAIALHALGYLVGAMMLRTTPATGPKHTGLLAPEVGSESLRWIELHGPVLVVALLLGLETAGGFDLLYKLSIAAAELLAGVGIIVLPALVRSRDRTALVERAVRAPTVLALGAAAVFAVAAGPVLEAVAGFKLESALVPALLAVPMALGPWMGVSRAALLTSNGARWLVPSQLATAIATVTASWLAVRGVLWASAAVALAHLAGASVRGWGMKTCGVLPRFRRLVSLGELRSDVGWLRTARSVEDENP